MKKILRNRAIRWVLLLVGLAAILALTGMNVYYLYDLRGRMVEEEQEQRIAELEEIKMNIQKDLYEPTWGLNKLELENIDESLAKTGQLPAKIMAVLDSASKAKVFDGIYYTPEGIDPCDEGAEIYRYNKEMQRIAVTTEYPDIVCDGVGLVRTKAKIRIKDFEYRWLTTTEFDTHRSMNIGLLNINESLVIGYFTFTLNEDYIINELISPMLKYHFGDSKESGVVAWLHNWVSQDVLATNDPDVEYDHEIVDHRYNFPNFFNNWTIKLAFLDTPATTAYTSTLFKNLLVLGVAVFFLMGALIFMFVTAQRERSLAQRQASFLANVTHELKTPLAVMQAAGENISDGRVTEQSRLKQYGQHIYSESIRLRRMIEKLLDVAKVDSGQAMIKPAPHRIYDLTNKYLKENREYIENKGFEIEFNAEDQKSVCMIDEDSFETVLTNLTENAIKYSTDEKFIRYTITSTDDEVFISIEDRGIGIAKKDYKNIFKKFYRVEDSLSAKTKGHGLGLSIVKNMVELNGGDIKVKSSVGKGTTFTVCFPKLVRDDKGTSSANNGTTSDKNLLEQSEYV